MSRLNPVLIEQVAEAVRQTGRLLTDPCCLERVEAKSPTDFVTNVDFSVQHRLEKALLQLTPWAQFWGEEGEKIPVDTAKPYWLLDPVDGTTNLIHSFQHSAISLGLVEEGRVTFGLVYQPYTHECFAAVRGKGAYCNGKRICVSKAEKLSQSLLSAGTVPGRRDLADLAFRQMRRLYDCCQDVRRTGCASLDLCWVACGRLEGFVELSLQPWDYAAGMLLVEEAGGMVTGPEGKPLSLQAGGGVLASNGLLHRDLLEMLK